MDTNAQECRTIHPWDQSIARHNNAVSELLRFAGTHLARADDTSRQLLPYGIYDTTMSYASHLERSGDYLGASVLRSHIGIHIDHEGDSR